METGTEITKVLSVPEEQLGELEGPFSGARVLDEADLLVQEAPRGCVQLSLDPVLCVHSDRRTRPRSAVQGEVDPRVQGGQRHLSPGVCIRKLLLPGVRVTFVHSQHPVLNLIQTVDQASNIVGMNPPKPFHLLKSFPK